MKKDANMQTATINVEILPSWSRKSAIKRSVEIVSVRVTSTGDAKHYDVLVRCDGRTFGVRAFGYTRDDGSWRIAANIVQQTWNDAFPPVGRRCQRRDAAHTIAIKYAVERHLLETDGC